MNPDFSIVVPAFNRIDHLRLTLRNLEAAISGMPAEIVVVDDGSDPSLEPFVATLGIDSVRVLRRENGGSAAARLDGIRAARGEFLLVCDSDDFIEAAKPRLHVEAMRREGSDVSYCDEGNAFLDEGPVEGAVPRIVPHRRLRRARSLADLLFAIQPRSNNVVYRTAWLQAAMDPPMIAARRDFGPAGDLWLFHNVVARPARLSKIEGMLSHQLRHDVDRYQAHWEKLGASSLLLAEEFVHTCPRTPETHEARMLKAAVAFRSWRTLPNGFSDEFDERLLAVWRALPRPPLAEMGGRGFRMLAALLGPATAARILRRRQRPAYDTVRTLDAQQLDALLRSMPPAPILEAAAP